MNPAFEEYAELEHVASEAESGRLKYGLDHAMGMLKKDPMHPAGLMLASYCARRMGAAVQAYHLASSGVRVTPTDDAMWMNLGAACQDLWLMDEAEHAYAQSLRYATKPNHKASLWLNLAALNIDRGDFAQGEEYVNKVLAAFPGHRNAVANLGFCQLARRDWANGWKNMRNTIGSDWRPRIQYRDEPEWDGSPGKVVALYEDQGVGDAISFASMLPDAIRASKKVILDCEPKLLHLFRRSFPEARIYPTRWEKGTSGETWAKEDRDFECSYPLGQIAEFFRTKDEDFSGMPYLTPCPVRTQMWRERFAAIGKPVIGIAWTGGVPRTNERFRQLTLEQLHPVLSSVDAHWVCLQYKDASREIEAFHVKHPRIDLVQYPWATLTKDYDDTAALIAALDGVACMQTAVGHTAGALGIPVTVLVPTATSWRYGKSGDSIPWYSSMRIVRQKTHGHWEREIEELAGILASWVQRESHDLGRVSAGAGVAPLKGRLRRDGGTARANGQCDH